MARIETGGKYSACFILSRSGIHRRLVWITLHSFKRTLRGAEAVLTVRGGWREFDVRKLGCTVMDRMGKESCLVRWVGWWN